MTVTVTGIKELKEFLKKITNIKTLDLMIRDMALDSAKLAREYAPEDTGRMESSISVHKITEGEYALVCNVPYAVFNEYGTYNMPVGNIEQPLEITSTSGKRAYRPFIRPAVFQILFNLKQYIKKYQFSNNKIL